MQQTKSASESAASLPPDGSARPGTWPAPFLRVQCSVLLSFPVAFSACDSKSSVRVLPNADTCRRPVKETIGAGNKPARAPHGSTMKAQSDNLPWERKLSRLHEKKNY